MPHVTVNGIELWHDCFGEGPPLLLISGLGQNSAAWAPARAALAARFRCHVFDNRGTGRSTVPPGPYSIETMADDTAALIAHLGLGHVPVVGWSLGGSVLQALMVGHPDSVAAGVLLNALPAYTGVQHEWLDALLALRRSGAPALAQVVSAMAWGLTGKTLHDHDRTLAMAEAAVADPYPTSVAGFEAQAAGLRIFDARPRLPQVRCPVLVLCGEEDVLTPPAQSREIADLIPDARLRLLPRGGHRMVVEYPDEVVQEIEAFLNARV